jgi:hypothetical protein
MARNTSSYFPPPTRADPRTPMRAARANRKPAEQPRDEGVRPSVILAIVIVALAWLLLGCSGLLWTIFLTADARTLALALVVWVLAFVGPSVIATAIAYRLEEDARPDGAGD